MKNTDIIIIDEVSMLSQKDFEQRELVCRTIMSSQLYFGGIQVIVTGDFYQLPPVGNIMYGDSGNYCFESTIWDKVISHRINLDEVIRQREPELIKAVRETALGCISADTDSYLKSFDRPLSIEMQPVHLFSRNIDTVLFNTDCLEQLNSEEKVYQSKKNIGPNKYLKRILAPNFLHLKAGCPVILLRNLGGKLVNGLSGVVKALDVDSVVIHFQQIQETHTIHRCMFSVYNAVKKCNVAEREQFPLTLGYAITIHKAQGMTLDSVYVHCQGIFNAGQLSVAIGRVKTALGLRLEHYRAGLCKQHKSCVTSYYRKESKEFMENLACCQNIILREDVGEQPGSEVDDTDDSEFDTSDLNEIEELGWDMPLNDLPAHIDPKQLCESITVGEQITETQIRISHICQGINLNRLVKFCNLHYIVVSKMIPDTARDQTTTKI